MSRTWGDKNIGEIFGTFEGEPDDIVKRPQRRTKALRDTKRSQIRRPDRRTGQDTPQPRDSIFNFLRDKVNTKSPVVVDTLS